MNINQLLGFDPQEALAAAVAGLVSAAQTAEVALADAAQAVGVPVSSETGELVAAAKAATGSFLVQPDEELVSIAAAAVQATGQESVIGGGSAKLAFPSELFNFSALQLEMDDIGQGLAAAGSLSPKEQAAALESATDGLVSIAAALRAAAEPLLAQAEDMAKGAGLAAGVSGRADSIAASNLFGPVPEGLVGKADIDIAGQACDLPPPVGGTIFG